MVDDSHQLIARSVSAFAEQGISVHTGHRVVELDLISRKIAVASTPMSRPRWESFDQLVLAMGARPILPELPGNDAEGIFTVHTLSDGIALNAFIDRTRPRRAVVAGGGYIGIEMAENLIRRGMAVTLIDRGPEVMATLDPDMGARVCQVLRQGGVAVGLEESLVGFESAGGRVQKVLTNRRSYESDLVVLGLGIRPNTDWLNGLMPLGIRNSVRVNDRQETAIPGIWAAGDCAQTYHLVSRQPFYVALGTVANKQGKVIGTNIAGGGARFPGVVGTAVTTFGETEIARTGLCREEIFQLGLDWAQSTITSKTRAGYYPGASDMTVKLLAEKGSGRLLGGQIVGGLGAAKRIDVVATALFAGMTVDTFSDLDLAYSPPLSPSWDPVLIAARQLLREL